MLTSAASRPKHQRSCGSWASCAANGAIKLTVATVIHVEREYSKQQLALASMKANSYTLHLFKNCCLARRLSQAAKLVFKQALVSCGTDTVRLWIHKTGSNQAWGPETEKWLHSHHLLCFAESCIPTYHVFKSKCDSFSSISCLLSTLSLKYSWNFSRHLLLTEEGCVLL